MNHNQIRKKKAKVEEGMFVVNFDQKYYLDRNLEIIFLYKVKVQIQRLFLNIIILPISNN